MSIPMNRSNKNLQKLYTYIEKQQRHNKHKKSTMNNKIKISTDTASLSIEQIKYENVQAKIQFIKTYYPSILGSLTAKDIVKAHFIENLLKNSAESEIQLPIDINEKLRMIYPQYHAVIKAVDELNNEIATSNINIDFYDSEGLLTEKALNELEEKHTNYAESEIQLKAYSIAKSLETNIDELNKILSASNKPLFYEYSQLHPTYINRIGAFSINLNTLINGI